MLRLYDHKEWYNEKRNIIHLSEVQRKHKRRQLERTIHPPPSMFNYMLKDIWEARRLEGESQIFRFCSFFFLGLVGF
jgi:hypothetical protein